MQRLLGPARTIFGNRDFTVLLVCNVLVGLAYSFVAPFLSMFGTLEVGMSPFVFSVFMTTTSIAAIGISTVLARWSDTRYSRRTILAVGGFSGMLGYLGFAFVRDVVGLTLVGAILLGLASNTFSQLFAYARDLLSRSDVPPAQTPLYMNVFRLFFALSWTVGPAAAAWVMSIWSYVGTFLVAGSLFGVFFLTVLLLVPAVPPSKKSLEAAAELPLSKAFKNGPLLAHFIGLALFFCCSTLGMMNLPLLILNELHGVEWQVGIAYSVAPIFELPLMLYFGLLASRSDHARLIRFALGLAVVYYALLSLVGAPWHVYPLQILSAAIVAVTSGVAITFFQNFLPNQAGTATNVYSTANRIGATVGYLLFGALLSAFGHRSVFVACAGLSLVASSILYAYRPERTAPIAA